MKFFSLLVALLGFLPFLAAAFPVADPVAEPEMHLEKRRSAQTCRIVNLRKGEYVNCRYGPTTKAGNIFAFRQGQKRTFSCKKKGQCIKGLISIMLFHMLQKLTSADLRASSQATRGDG
ncbi:hypothetical protein RJZ90_004319 [Blastomyces dermatitidis]